MPTQPFFLMVSFPDPHHPFNPPGKYWDMYKPEQFPVPEAFSRNDWTPPALVQQHHQGTRGRQGQSHRHEHHRRVGARGAGGEGADLRDDRLRRRCHWRRARRARSQRTARRHRGDLHQRPRRPPRRSPVDAQRCRAISGHRAGAVHLVRSRGSGDPPRSQALGSTMDISATMLDRARIEPFSGMQGRSLTPALRRRAGPARQRVHPVRPSAPKSGHRRAAAGPHPDRRPLPPERVPRHRMGRALRSRRRSRRVRQPVGRSGARRRRARA